MPVVASVVATGLVVGGATWMAARPSLDRLVQHLSLAHPQPEVVGGNDFDDNIAVSPDGRSVASSPRRPRSIATSCGSTFAPATGANRCSCLQRRVHPSFPQMASG